MTNEQLSRNLQSVGMAVFVEYFESFSSELMSREEIIGRLKSEKKYTVKSCISRTRHARSIIQAGLASAALQKVIGSDSQNVSELTRAKAQHLLVSIPHLGRVG